MKTSLKILLAAAALSAASLAATAPASAQPTSFSFRVGDVAMGFNDGYYDRDHRWHHWRNAREHRWYRTTVTASRTGSTGTGTMTACPIGMIADRTIPIATSA